MTVLYIPQPYREGEWQASGKKRHDGLRIVPLHPDAVRHKEYPKCRTCKRKYINECLFCKHHHI